MPLYWAGSVRTDQAGALKLDELVSRHCKLDQINEAFTDLREGRNIRGIVDFAG